MTESDAPILSELIVTASGELVFGKDLVPEKCRKVSSQELKKVESLVEAARRTSYSTSKKFGRHYEQVQLRFDSRVLGVVAGEDYPTSFEALIEYLDRLFESKFGDAYQIALDPFYGRPHHSAPPVEIEGTNCPALPVHEMLFLDRVTVSDVYGMVAEYDSGTPLEGVILILQPAADPSESHHAATSDEQGRFSFTGLEDGLYRLWMCLPGWEITMLDVEVSSSANSDPLKVPLVHW